MTIQGHLNEALTFARQLLDELPDPDDHHGCSTWIEYWEDMENHIKEAKEQDESDIQARLDEDNKRLVEQLPT